MHEAARTMELGLDKTWKSGVTGLEVSEVSTVRTLRVTQVGTPRDTESQVAALRVTHVAPTASGDTVTTQRFGSWSTYAAERRAAMRRDSDRTALRDDALQQLALARTIPALMPEELGLEASGVQEIRRVQLWLEPRDRAPCAAGRAARVYDATLRISANPLVRAWQLRHELPAPVAFGIAASVSFFSALALGLLLS